MPQKNSSNSRNQQLTAKNLVFLSVLFLFLASRLISPAFGASATAESAMVVTQHPLATEAALQILKEGGNAADAAITAQFVLNVVEPHSSGLGGGGFFLYYDRVKRSVTSLDGREAAPSSAKPEMFLRDGKVTPFFPERVTGGLSVGIPGTPAMIQKVYDRFASGTLTLEHLIAPALKFAESGVPVSKALANNLAENAERLSHFPETKKIFFHENGSPLKEGDMLTQPDLAKTLRLFGQKKAALFYRGEIARAIRGAVTESPIRPTAMSLDDLKEYEVKEKDPVYGNYRGLDVFAPNLPTSGGILLLENLNILETFNISEWGWDSQPLHYLNEAQKLTFSDRSQMGDFETDKVNSDQFISKEYAHEKAVKIESQKALRRKEIPIEDGKQTSHFSIVDRLGNMVSWTSTIEMPFGSGITVPGYGFLLNNELTDFDAEPYDADGKLKPNAPGARKRPLSSMTPAFIFNKGKPLMVVGSPGGTTIVGTVLNVIVNRVDFKMNCEEAVAKPRLIFRSGKMEMEAGLYDHPLIRLQLELWGHDTEKSETIGNAQVICFDASRQEIVGVSDPRGIGKAEGY